MVVVLLLLGSIVVVFTLKITRVGNYSAEAKTFLGPRGPLVLPSIGRSRPVCVQEKSGSLREAVKNYLADFFR